MKRLFSTVSIWELWKAIAVPPLEANESESTSKSDAQLVLMKFADVIIHEESMQEPEGLNINYFIPTMAELEVAVTRLFADSNSQGMAEIEDITSSIRLHLDIFETRLNTPNNQLSLTDSSKLTELLVGRIKRSFAADGRFSCRLAQVYSYPRTIPIFYYDRNSITITDPGLV